jgi:hypothetical protein
VRAGAGPPVPCAPRPIKGELLSSWARRLAAANLLTLPELCARLEDFILSQEKAPVFDYCSLLAKSLAAVRFRAEDDRGEVLRAI